MWSLFAVAALIVGLLMVQVPANPLAWGAPAGATEILPKRTRDAKHFLNPDGSRTAVFGKVLHFEPTIGAGAWEDRDTNFRSDGAGGFIADRIPHAVHLSGTTLSATDRASGKGISYTLPAGATVAGNSIDFTLQGVQFSWKVSRLGLKLSAVVAAPVGPKTYTFNYARLGGAAALVLNPDGSIRGDGYVIPAPTVVGANRQRYTVGAWAMTATTLSFSFDDSALPPEAYPYELDPSTTFSVAAGADDARLYRYDPATYPPTTTDGLITTATTDAAERSYSAATPQYFVSVGVMRWDTSSILDDATITDAVARLNVRTTADADSRNLTADWMADAAVADTDYTITPGTSAHGGTAVASVAQSADNDFALSSPAANIDTGGFTKLRWHIDGGQPTGLNFVDIASFDDATLAEPRLIVTYVRYGPPAHSGIDESATGTGTAPAITLANTPNPGDFLVFHVYSAGSNATAITTADARLTREATNGSVGGTGGSARSGAMFYGFWQSGDSLTFTFASANAAWVVEKVAYSGIDDVNTVLASAGAANASAANTAPAITPGSGLRAVFVMGASTKNGATFSAEAIGGSATGVTERRDTANGTSMAGCMYDRIDTSTPAGTVAGAQTPSANAIGTGHSAAFRGLDPAPPVQKVPKLLRPAAAEDVVRKLWA